MVDDIGEGLVDGQRDPAGLVLLEAEATGETQDEFPSPGEVGRVAQEPDPTAGLDSLTDQPSRTGCPSCL